MAHKTQYHLNPDYPSKLKITWNGGEYGFQKDIVVSYNDVPLRTFLTREEVLTPQTVQLPGLDPITIVLEDYAFVIKQKGRKIDKSTPEQIIAEFYQSMPWYGLIFIGIGLLSLTMHFLKLSFTWLSDEPVISFFVVVIGCLFLILHRIGSAFSIRKLIVSALLLLLSYCFPTIIFPFFIGEQPGFGDYLGLLPVLHIIYKLAKALYNHKGASKECESNTQNVVS
jgi:hypothetical protein